jgi:integrase
VDRWLDHIADAKSPTTMRNYRGYNRRYIQPALGSKPLRKLKAEDLDNFYRAVLRRAGSPLAPATVHAIVRSSLTQAVRWGWLSVDPAVLATAPSVPRSQISSPSIDVCHQVLAEARVIGPEIALFFRIGAATGARRAEVIGLRWFDLVAATLHITRSVVMDDRVKRLVVKDTKTDHARRISLDSVTAMLAEHRRLMEARAKLGGMKLAKDAYVFPTASTVRSRGRPDRVSLAFYRIKTTLGLEVRLRPPPHARHRARVRPWRHRGPRRPRHRRRPIGPGPGRHDAPMPTTCPPPTARRPRRWGGS